MVVHTGVDLPVAALTNGTYAGSVSLWQMLRGNEDYSGFGSSLHRFCLAADRVDVFAAGPDAEAVAYAFDTLDEVRGERFSPSPTNWSLDSKRKMPGGKPPGPLRNSDFLLLAANSRIVHNP